MRSLFWGPQQCSSLSMNISPVRAHCYTPNTLTHIYTGQINFLLSHTDCTCKKFMYINLVPKVKPVKNTIPLLNLGKPCTIQNAKEHLIHFPYFKQYSRKGLDFNLICSKQLRQINFSPHDFSNFKPC